jgi:hypothetical protein
MGRARPLLKKRTSIRVKPRTAPNRHVDAVQKTARLGVEVATGQGLLVLHGAFPCPSTRRVALRERPFTLDELL